MGRYGEGQGSDPRQANCDVEGGLGPPVDLGVPGRWVEPAGVSVRRSGVDFHAE